MDRADLNQRRKRTAIRATRVPRALPGDLVAGAVSGPATTVREAREPARRPGGTAGPGPLPAPGITPLPAEVRGLVATFPARIRTARGNAES